MISLSYCLHVTLLNTIGDGHQNASLQSSWKLYFHIDSFQTISLKGNQNITSSLSFSLQLWFAGLQIFKTYNQLKIVVDTLTVASSVESFRENSAMYIIYLMIPLLIHLKETLDSRITLLTSLFCLFNSSAIGRVLLLLFNWIWLCQLCGQHQDRQKDKYCISVGRVKGYTMYRN